MITLRISKKKLAVFFISIGICLINRKVSIYTSGVIHWFLTCYFNDIIGTIAFSAYCDIISDNTNLKYQINRFWKMELLLLFCGLFWEYITPLFRTDTVGDVLDIVAYLLGGALYWLMKKLECFC